MTKGRELFSRALAARQQGPRELQAFYDGLSRNDLACLDAQCLSLLLLRHLRRKLEAQCTTPKR